MHKRFIDRPIAKTILKNTEGFFLRGHGSYIIWICLSLIILAGTAKFIIDDTASKLFDDQQALAASDILVVIITMTIAAMILGGYLLFNIMKLKYIINITEFQAALFSSAMKTHTLLTCIVDKDKNVIYSDENAFRLFKNKDNDVETLADILAYEGLTAVNKAKIDSAVTQGTKEEMNMTYKNIAGKSLDTIFIIDPLARPKGFSVIRCYDLKGRVL